MRLVKIDVFLNKYNSTADKALNLNFVTLREANGPLLAEVGSLLKEPVTLLIASEEELKALMEVIRRAEEFRDIDVIEDDKDAFNVE